MPPDAFSLPQVMGYIAFVFGVASFLQKRDDRMKAVNSVQCAIYAYHFHLLHEPAAAISNLIGLTRNLLSLKFSSRWLALPLFIATGVFAFFTVKSPADAVPIVSTVLSIYGMFWLSGIAFRLSMLSCTSLWLLNNFLVHSYGGLALEATIACANIYTILQLRKASLDGTAAG